jgi:hypothetical protein
MEPEGSSPHFQVPVTCPCPEPAQSNPYPHIPLLEDPSLSYDLCLITVQHQEKHIRYEEAGERKHCGKTQQEVFHPMTHTNKKNPSQ